MGTLHSLPSALPRVTRIHVALDVDADRLSDTKLAECIAILQIKVTVAELRRQCIYHRAQGRKVIPPCEHTDAEGHCLGHRGP